MAFVTFVAFALQHTATHCNTLLVTFVTFVTFYGTDVTSVTPNVTPVTFSVRKLDNGLRNVAVKTDSSSLFHVMYGSFTCDVGLFCL